VNPGRLSFEEAYLYVDTAALFNRRFKKILKASSSLAPATSRALVGGGVLPLRSCSHASPRVEAFQVFVSMQNSK
jgi:hypothetical protein